MPKTKPPYPAEFRSQIVDLFHAGRSASELSQEFGVSSQSISAWVTRSVAERGSKPPRNKDVLTNTEREELSRLRRQVKQLQQERDILAKATAWFAGRGEKTSNGSMNS
jgi:transposase